MWGCLAVRSKPARLARNPVACVTANMSRGWGDQPGTPWGRLCNYLGSQEAHTLWYIKPALPALGNVNHNLSLNATVMNFIRIEGKKTKTTQQKNQNPEGEAATRVHPNFPAVLFALRSFGKSRQKHLLHFVSEDLITHWICWDNVLQPCSRFQFLMHLGDFGENLQTFILCWAVTKFQGRKSTTINHLEMKIITKWKHLV